MARLFLEEQHIPIEIRVKDKKGDKHDLDSKPITLEDLDRFEKIGTKLKADESVVDQIIEMLITIFGNDKKFWKGFSLQLLHDIIDLVTKEIKNVKKKS